MAAAQEIEFKKNDRVKLDKIDSENVFYKNLFGVFFESKMKELKSFMTTVGVVLGTGEFNLGDVAEQVVTAEFKKDGQSYYLNLPASDLAAVV
jgi:hypothetical protein